MARILVADDDPSVQKLIRLTLELEGHDVVAVADGAAVAAAGPATFDLVVLDVMMPGLDGIDVCRALRVDPATAGLGVVMLSARAQDADAAAGRAAGADVYLTKPFEPLDLARTVDAVLSKSKRCAPGRDEPIPLPR